MICDKLFNYQVSEVRKLTFFGAPQIGNLRLVTGIHHVAWLRCVWILAFDINIQTEIIIVQEGVIYVIVIIESIMLVRYSRLD
jgi:hypothetical protein